LYDDSSDDDEADPYLKDYTPPESRRAGLRANKWRGQRPDGCWRTRARLIDFTDSADIEESIPPYSDQSGRRYGQHRFPLSRLRDENNNPIEDGIACYRHVTLWRKLSPAEQQIEVDAIRAKKKARKKAKEKQQKKRKADDKCNKGKQERRRARGLTPRGRKKKHSTEGESEAAADGEQAGSQVSSLV
jgi:hypothetical protein